MKKYAVILAAVLFLCTACQPRNTENTEPDTLESAREFYAGGFYLAAEEEYQKYLEEASDAPDRFEAWNRLVDISLAVKGDYTKAAGMLETVYLEFGNTQNRGWAVLNRLGDVYVRLGEDGKALRAYENSLPMIGDDAVKEQKTRRAMVQSYRRLGSHVLAIKLLEECVDSSNTDITKANCMYELAQEYVFAENFAKAADILEHVLEISALPEYDRAVSALLLSDIYEEQGRREEAKQLLTTLVGAYPNPEVVKVRLQKYS